MGREPLRVLMVEDNEDDALLVSLELRRAGYAPELRRVDSPHALRAELREAWDVVVSDYMLPTFDGLDALRIVRELKGSELPFVLISGTIGEEKAVEALKSGAGDFVTKQNLSRLVPALEREIADARVRRERRETLEALRQAIAARDQFLSIASHELKTPLTSLQLQLQSLERLLLTGAGEDERVAHKLHRVMRATQRMGELVDRLLDVTRINSGALKLMRDEIDLTEVVAEVVSLFAESFKESGSCLDLAARGPVRGCWDRMRVETILTNLVSNAIKYGEGGPIEIRVAAEERMARVSVKDHGIGIAPADQARIFERFERAVPERHYGGFGLGLWVARFVAEAHGGALHVQSAPGSGSVFTLELPIGELGA